jgi:transcriptional regulator with XRE-family HTH domain
MTDAVLRLLREIEDVRDLPAPTVARRLRQDAGVSQLRLAQSIGVNRSTVSRWEAGSSRPGAGLAAKYLSVLKHFESDR